MNDIARRRPRVRIIEGIAAIADRFDAFLLDQWGVIHDGAKPYPGVVACLERLASAGKRVVMLSNAPRRAALSRQRLATFGIPADLVTAIVTSGEATHQAIAARDRPNTAALGRHYLHLGRNDHSDDVLVGLYHVRVDVVAAADFLLATNLVHETDGLAPYEATLGAAVGRRLPLVCANPDVAVVHNGRRELCAGALAARYEALGGPVLRFGKPYPEVYRMAFVELGPIPPARVLAVGDGLATDIAGGIAQGLPTLLVTGGLLAAEWGVAADVAPHPERLAEVCADAGSVPDFAIATFVW
ncbi:MAG: TIGR01459 family HAD-type hydrolase [Alphaproteobacteria bacterium]|nr:TIGR01459 family HAD-type hydrolase [Alphaproteobacteria bacterium]